MKSIIRLFKAVPIDSKRRKKASKSLLKKTLEKGFVFSPKVVFNYSAKELEEIIKLVEKEVGLTPTQMNSSFHKSWAKISHGSMFQLVMEQLIHYFSTYGREYFGIYDTDHVFIPDEKLEIPELKGGITVTVIKGYTKEELKEKLLSLLNQGIALGEDTIKDVVDVSLFVDVNEEEIEQIRNKETKAILYDLLGKFPEYPIEFLRFLVYKSTKKTLLIKDKATIEKIKAEQNIDVLRLLRQYRDKHGLEKLAQIFFRFKPLFLAFRTNSGTKPIINRIRKLANVHHRPMKPDYLNDVTATLKRDEVIEEEELRAALEKVNTFRKIRLAYALNFRTMNVDSILYKIRNGKGYATDFSFDNKEEAKRVYDIVLESIVENVTKNVKGKKIYIPENMVYSLPATEKQFTGDFPSGSYIVIPKDLIAGVHWADTKKGRIDLDLSLLSLESGKIGWDASYRTEDRAILFSGDLTEAHNGASELFYIQRQGADAFIVFLNYYNFKRDDPVPFKILVAKETPENFGKNYMIDPNNVLCIAKSKIDVKQKILGLIITTPDECRFYFSETSIGNSITSTKNNSAEKSRKYLYDFYTNAISLNEVLVLAGAKLVTKKKDADIDLSPENLEKDKIIKLFVNK